MKIKRSFMFAIAAALSLTTTTLYAGDNPFRADAGQTGMQLAEMKDGKCGSGKCGAGMKAEQPMKDGKCGKMEGSKGMKDGKCGSGKCGAGMKAKPSDKPAKSQGMSGGKCGAGKCGSM